jgi:hypothetical protein
MIRTAIFLRRVSGVRSLKNTIHSMQGMTEEEEYAGKYFWAGFPRYGRG